MDQNNADSMEGPQGSGRQATDRQANIVARSGTSSTSADNTQLNIFDMNEYCITEVMRYLCVDTLLTLELTNLNFGQYSPYFYARVPWRISIERIKDYPEWVWRKIGRYVVDLKLDSVQSKTEFNRLLGYFPNVQKLCVYNGRLYNVPNLPKQVSCLSLNSSSISKQCGVWLQGLSSTLTAIDLVEPWPTSSSKFIKHLRHIRRASLSCSQLSVTGVAKFLENNRHSLESLALYNVTTDEFTEICFENLEMMSKLTGLCVSLSYFNEILLNQLSAIFRTKIKCLSIMNLEGIWPELNEVGGFDQLECLTTLNIGIMPVLQIITNTPSIKYIHPCMRYNMDEFLRNLKPILESQNRKMILNMQSDEVCNIEKYSPQMQDEHLQIVFREDSLWCPHNSQWI